MVASTAPASGEKATAASIATFVMRIGRLLWIIIVREVPGMSHSHMYCKLSVISSTAAVKSGKGFSAAATAPARQATSAADNRSRALVMVFLMFIPTVQ
jgi:hypothetical protein